MRRTLKDKGSEKDRLIMSEGGREGEREREREKKTGEGVRSFGFVRALVKFLRVFIIPLFYSPSLLSLSHSEREKRERERERDMDGEGERERERTHEDGRLNYGD